jgi:hypothetical protein
VLRKLAAQPVNREIAPPPQSVEAGPSRQLMPSNGANGEHIRGVLCAQLVLIDLLEQKGFVGRQEYADALQVWLDNLLPQEQGAARYDPLHALIQKLRHEDGPVQRQMGLGTTAETRSVTLSAVAD